MWFCLDCCDLTSKGEYCFCRLSVSVPFCVSNSEEEIDELFVVMVLLLSTFHQFDGLNLCRTSSSQLVSSYSLGNLSEFLSVRLGGFMNFSIVASML